MVIKKLGFSKTVNCVVQAALTRMNKNMEYGSDIMRMASSGTKVASNTVRKRASGIHMMRKVVLQRNRRLSRGVGSYV